MFELKLSHAEKVIARRAFDLALEKELQATIHEAKRRIEPADAPFSILRVGTTQMSRKRFVPTQGRLWVFSQNSLQIYHLWWRAKLLSFHFLSPQLARKAPGAQLAVTGQWLNDLFCLLLRVPPGWSPSFPNPIFGVTSALPVTRELRIRVGGGDRLSLRRKNRCPR